MRRLIIVFALVASLAPAFATKAHAYESWSADSVSVSLHRGMQAR